MDLYADLPLAKGASSAALDADGKLKTGNGGGSVWKTAAPAFVPQVMRNANANQQQAGRGKPLPPAIITKSPMRMVPAALRTKSPHGSAINTGKSTSASPASVAGVKKASGVLLAFRPASVTRKSPTVATTRQLPSASPANLNASTQLTIGGTSILDAKLDDAELRPRGIGFGFSSVTTTTSTTTTSQVRITKDDSENHQPAVNTIAASAGGSSAHSFQSNYRDEYNPARPNSYEAYCEERLNKKKLEQVKRELERRQQEQEREGKLEREKLVRDIEAGNAPAADLAAAGRGRGMTMPAWMRKKMEETAAAKQVESQQVMERAEVGQFEDADPRTGLGFAGRQEDQSSAFGPGATTGLGFVRSEMPQEHEPTATNSLRSTNAPPALLRDEFGREIKQIQLRSEQHDKPGRDDDSAVRTNQPQQDGDARERQREHSETGAPATASALKPPNGCVILLENMVGPGEVDDDLQEEVKEECAEKYGPVDKCVIYEVRGRVSPEEAVRIFVQFRRPSDAEKARLGLNARFFGGRKVQASYYDDGKFSRLDLTA